jgi:hypothetical protein
VGALYNGQFILKYIAHERCSFPTRNNSILGFRFLFVFPLGNMSRGLQLLVAQYSLWDVTLQKYVSLRCRLEENISFDMRISEF